MKILQLRSDLIENGPATQLKSLTDAWQKQGHEVVIASGGGIFADKLLNDGYNYRQLPRQVFGSRSVKGSVHLFQEVFRLIVNERPDVIVCHNMLTTLICWLARIFGLRFFRLAAMVHGLDYSKHYRNWVYLIPVKLISISSYTTDWLLRLGVNRTRIVEVPNGVDSEVFNKKNAKYYREEIRSEFGLDNTDFVFGLVGRMGIKGHDLLIRAVAEIIHERGYTNVKALLVGTGAKFESFQELARNLGVENNICFAGLRLDSYRFYPAMDVYTLLSTEGEVLPISIIEAMAYGLPTIASDLSGIPDLINGQNGTLVIPGDLDDIVEKCLCMLEQEFLRVSQGENAQHDFYDHYDIQVTSQRILNGI